MSTWYIGTTGSDTTGDGTSGNPYATIGKCITVGADGDTVKALTGTYNIASVINITKQITITSNSGINTDVIFETASALFNIQNSNVSITYITIRSPTTGATLITIDKMSGGSTVPTFWTGNTISNCIFIAYYASILDLTGNFTISNNIFQGLGVQNITINCLIRVFSTRGLCTITNNTVNNKLASNTNGLRSFIYMTINTTDISTYRDRCASKGGTLNITNNTVNNASAKPANFIYQDHFNAYTYGPVGEDTQYNVNTKLTLNVSNNTMNIPNENGKFINGIIDSNTSLKMFNVCTINNNTINNSNCGIVHLSKKTPPTGTLTIDSTDLNRNVYKIYSNILSTPRDGYHFPFSSTVEQIITNNTSFVVYKGTLATTYIDSSAAGLRNGQPSVRSIQGYVQIEDNNNGMHILKANESFTFQFYIKMAVMNFRQLCFVLNNGRTDGITFFANESLIGPTLAVQSTNFTMSTQPMLVNTWYHICIARNLSTQAIELYIDEVLVGQIPTLNSVIINNSGYNNTIIWNYANLWMSDFIFRRREYITTKIVQ